MLREGSKCVLAFCQNFGERLGWVEVVLRHTETNSLSYHLKCYVLNGALYSDSVCD